MCRNKAPERGMVVLIISLMLAGSVSYGQLVINEVCATGSREMEDEDGDFGDWIELYNIGGDTLDLQNYSLSDELSVPAKWTFPEYRIPPGAYLAIFASGKDRKSSPLWWHTLINEGDDWSFILPDASTPGNWREPGYNDSSWETGPSGFGYGDDDDATILPSTASIFLRKQFVLDDTEPIRACALHMDFDDGFVAFLNGKEIARSGVLGEFPAYDVTAYEGREAQMYNGGELLRFDLPLERDLLRNGDNVISVQVHNVSATSSDLSAIPYFSILSTEKPDKAPPHVLALGDIRFHTSFKLDADGESLYLNASDLSLVDSVNFPALGAGHSLGRKAADSKQWVVYTSPTPEQANAGAFFEGYVEDAPQFSRAPGRFSEPFQLVLSATDHADSIFYTLDGSIPEASSQIYSGPLEISSGTVVRARILKGDKVPGDVVTHTYFKGTDNRLPVLTLSTHPDNLWDYHTGIYVKGPDAGSDFPYFNANFWEDWERPAHIEVYDETGEFALELDGGIKIYGGWTRGHAQKSMAIFARNQYGTGKIEYSFFGDKPITEFEAIVIRNSGNDWFGAGSESGTMFRDVLMTRLTRGMDVEYQAARQAVVYINGEYWGIHNIREKINEHFLASNQGVDPDQVELLEGNQIPIIGDASHFAEMMDFIGSNDMSRDDVMQEVSKRMNIQNFMNYQVAQIYYDNRDWPGNNIKYWRPDTDQGRWRWIIYDTDFGFGLWDLNKVNDNTLLFATETNGPGHPNPPWSTLLLRELLKNEGFKRDYINTFADRINTNFRSDSVSALVDLLKNNIDQEMLDHAERWGGSHMTWIRQARNLKEFGRLRPSIIQNHLMNTYRLPASHKLTLEVSDPEWGFIGLNSIVVKDFPWEGTYFQGNPVELTAICKAGYRFEGWTGAVNSKEARITVNLSDASFLMAHFEPIINGTESPVVINEICYMQDPNADCDDWVELYNRGDQYMDISGWILKDSDDLHAYHIADGTILHPGAYHVVCGNPGAYAAVYPFTTSCEGAMNFGLSSSGDAVRLYDRKSELLDHVNYGVTSPWPELVSGSGLTLSLIDPGLDNALASSWESSHAPLGTPGGNNAFTLGGEHETVTALQNRLLPNSPNPFSGSTRIVFHSGSSQLVSISVYNLNGRLVEMLANKYMDAGYHDLEWIPNGVPSGIYILRVKTPESVHTQKMVLQR